jgi:uncharacterized protein (TIGR03435 family)
MRGRSITTSTKENAMRWRLVSIVALVVLYGTLAFTQSRPATPAYEVVSIRHAPGATPLNNVRERPGGGFALERGTAATLIGQAYTVLAADVVGLPAWATRDAYNIVATASRPGATADDRRAMKRALLAERFQLRTHDEMRETASFDLVRARRDGTLGPGLVVHPVDCAAQALAEREAERTGTALSQTPASPCGMRVTAGGLGGEMTMDLLASLLRSIVGRPVINRTSLDGTYRVTLQYDHAATLRADTRSSQDLPSLADALQEQLGLRLENSRTSMRVLVVDAIERPSEN